MGLQVSYRFLHQKYRRQVIYKDIKSGCGANIRNIMQKKRDRNYRGRMLQWSYPYADKNSTEIFRVRNSGIFEREKARLWYFEKHANLKYKYGNRHFWCRGYYVDTAGKNTAAIKAYIQNQLKEDLEYDQMSLVEYIDPFTGEPVKKNKK